LAHSFAVLHINTMGYLWKTPVIGRLVFDLWKLDAARKYGWVSDWVSPDDSIVEIGSGPGSVLSVFRDHGLNVDGLDIQDSSFAQSFRPKIYEGDVMPYPDDHFDIAMLLTMLHHTTDPDAILQEASRIAPRLIIIEDVYDNPLQRKLTTVTDSLTNLEFAGHPHSNRSDPEWVQTFETLGLTLRHKAIYPVLKLFKQAVYVVERPL